MIRNTIHTMNARTMLLGCAILLAATAGRAPAAAVERAPFGETPKGEKIEMFTITNGRGMIVKAITYGAVITEIHVPDRAGKVADVALGSKDAASYLKGTAYMGAVVGRYGNRIADAEFTIDGTAYKLEANNGKNSLHGGSAGFSNVVWKGEPLQEAGRSGVRLSYVSPDGDQGFPGQLTTQLTYWLPDNANELRIEFNATTTKPTVVNLAGHSYFNLAGEGNGLILDQKLTINAPYYLPIDSTSIPTGEMRPVAGTPFDFTKPTAIGSRIDSTDEQIKFGKGYDHCFVLAKRRVGDLTLAARASEAASGRVLEIWTTEPGVQLYTGNYLDGTQVGVSGKPYQERSGFALETQHFPDSPNKAQFPSTVLRPGDKFHSETVYKFLTE